MLISMAAEASLPLCLLQRGHGVRLMLHNVPYSFAPVNPMCLRCRAGEVNILGDAEIIALITSRFPHSQASS